MVFPFCSENSPRPGEVCGTISFNFHRWTPDPVDNLVKESAAVDKSPSTVLRRPVFAPSSGVGGGSGWYVDLHQNAGHATQKT